MKKFIALLSLSFVAFTLVACGNNNQSPAANDDGPVGIERPMPEPVVPTPDGDIVIRYANWNLGTVEENNIERRMIEAFMEAHPGVVIEIDEAVVTGDGHWNERLAIAASTGNLPDVFMVDDIGVNLNNGWSLDISSIANADSDFTALPQNMRDAMSVGGRVYSVPFAQHMFGYFINLDLFDALNLDAPTIGFSVEELEVALRSVSDINAPLIGTNHIDYFTTWMPATLNNTFGWLTFDGSSFNIDSPEMHTAVQRAIEFNNNGFVFDGLEYEVREVFNGGWGGEVFFNGQMGLLWDATWAVGNIAAQSEFNWKFIGVPGGRPMVTIDILNIAYTTEHADVAYAFASWMGSGTDGFTRRMEIANEMGTIVNALPISGNQALLDNFWSTFQADGVAEVYANLDNAIIDRNKVTPGWPVIRWQTQTGIQIGDNDNATTGDVLWNAVRGNITFTDHANRVNEVMQEAFENITNDIR